MPEDGDRPARPPRLEPIPFPPTGEFPRIDDVFPGGPAAEPARATTRTLPPAGPPRFPVAARDAGPAPADRRPPPDEPPADFGSVLSGGRGAGRTSASGDHPRHPSHPHDQGSSGPARKKDPTILIVVCVLVVVALVAGALAAAGILHAPSAHTAGGSGTAKHQSVDSGGQSTLARLALPATLKVKGGVKPKLPWPTTGEAIVAVSRLGTMGKSGGDAARPIASITKVMTAYIVLTDHPLKAGQSGPTITVSAAEAAAYPAQQAGHQSLVKVTAGEQITEYQALQALLIASGDNIAQILARWDAGGIPAFVARMNAMAKSLEMTKTHFVDPDGLSSQSVSNSEDLLELASVALAEPAMVEIMQTRQATIPLNTIKNYNTLLGQDGVFGIKTGSTTPAGGCLLFAAERTVGGKTYSIFGAVLGAPGTRATILKNALTESKALIEAAAPALQPVTLIKAGTPVATVRNAAGQTSTYAVDKDVVVNGWKGLSWHLRLSSSLKPGQGPGQVIVKASTGQLTVPLSKVATRKK